MKRIILLATGFVLLAAWSATVVYIILKYHAKFHG